MLPEPHYISFPMTQKSPPPIHEALHFTRVLCYYRPGEIRYRTKEIGKINILFEASSVLVEPTPISISGSVLMG